MEDIDLRQAKEQLEDLIQRATRGEDVRISDPKVGTVRLTPIRPHTPMGDVRAQRVTDTMERFVPLAEDRVPGRLKGKMKVPARLMEPMSEEELKDWYGDDA
jgi:antitoxin (DNA-binding transcriptional repressor) of toxin-antitoxin stability system